MAGINVRKHQPLGVVSNSLGCTLAVHQGRNGHHESNDHRKENCGDISQNLRNQEAPMSVAQNSVQNSAIRDVAVPAALPDKSQRAAILCGCIVAFAYSANYTNHAPLALALMREFSFNQALA